MVTLLKQRNRCAMSKTISKSISDRRIKRFVPFRETGKEKLINKSNKYSWFKTIKLFWRKRYKKRRRESANTI